MKGKHVIEREQFIYKVRAAVEARGNSNFFIVARTDALAVKGLDEAIARVEAAREVEANASFVEAPDSADQSTLGAEESLMTFSEFNGLIGVEER